MLTRRGRVAPTDLARIALTLRPLRSRRAWAGLGAALAVAALAGATAHHLHGRLQEAVLSPHVDALQGQQGLAEAVERAGLQLRVAEARSQELERQVDILNQRLHASQEELTFFRKAVNGKR